MSDDKRRRRFMAYFDVAFKGDRARFMQKTKFSPGRVSQLFDDRQPFGEKAARSLAERLGLDHEYFERDVPSPAGDAASDPLAAVLLEEFGSDAQRSLAAARRLRTLADQLESRAAGGGSPALPPAPTSPAPPPEPAPQPPHARRRH